MGNFSQREQSEVKAAEFAYPCTHTHKRTQIHKHSIVVLRENTSSKKIAWNLAGNPDWWSQSVASREGMVSECFQNHAAPALFLTHFYKLYSQHRCLFIRKMCSDLKEYLIFWGIHLLSFLLSSAQKLETGGNRQPGSVQRKQIL